MNDDIFESIVKKALFNLPAEFKDRLENVSVIIADIPTQDQYKKIYLRGKTLLLGLYEGVPQTKRGNYGIGPTLPDKITIFKYPIIYLSQGDEKRIIELIIDTVKHEIAHHFGMSDEDIRKAKKI